MAEKLRLANKGLLLFAARLRIESSSVKCQEAQRSVEQTNTTGPRAEVGRGQCEKRRGTARSLRVVAPCGRLGSRAGGGSPSIHDPSRQSPWPSAAAIRFSIINSDAPPLSLFAPRRLLRDEFCDCRPPARSGGYSITVSPWG